ncbi:hypothetical protein BFN67_15145 [Pseudaminobacter manganicus]|uniref:Uncharacterized protein n=1 Tax=Manganibacter manganicus TaxID=1873176 RepID=A0A1V8RT88_9HYPH|nr:hypothetical protein BFN67_15145 [Pseudaminobacter manganicus]
MSCLIVIGIHATVHNIGLTLYVIAVDLVGARVRVVAENLGSGIKSKTYLRRDGKTVEPIEKVALA